MVVLPYTNNSHTFTLARKPLKDITSEESKAFSDGSKDTCQTLSE